MPAPFEFGKQVGNDPMAAVNAKRVADMKSMAAKVRGASGTPNPTGDGTHRWSGRVLPGGNVQGAQYTPPSTPLVKQPQQSASLQKAPPAQSLPTQSMMSTRPAALRRQTGPRTLENLLNTNETPPAVSQPQFNTTVTKVDNAELRKQLQQAQQQQSTPLTKQPPAAPPAPAAQPALSQPQPSLFQRAMGMIPGASAMANQTGAGPVSAPLSATSTAFNNATGQQDPPHIITTDNGRKFNTQTKTFLDGRPGGFAR